jgi:L-asparagine permease
MAAPTTYDNSALAHEEEGYDKGLKPRQLQMIAIGGAIGTGLFMVHSSRTHANSSARKQLSSPDGCIS